MDIYNKLNGKGTENTKEKTVDKYYVEAEYNYKDWDIDIGEPNEKPSDWQGRTLIKGG